MTISDLLDAFFYIMFVSCFFSLSFFFESAVWTDLALRDVASPLLLLLSFHSLQVFFLKLFVCVFFKR